MAKQLGFSDYEQTTAKKRTKIVKFLAEMDQVVQPRPLGLSMPFLPGWHHGSHLNTPSTDICTLIPISSTPDTDPIDY